jgi:hypothetical protein
MKPRPGVDCQLENLAPLCRPSHLSPRIALDVATVSIYTIGMKFVWDEEKNRANIRKHGIDFRDDDGL